MDLKHFTNQEDGVYELLISGVVGEKVDGDQVAAEIKFLNEIGAKIIRERINSIGGQIINGMSIITANLESKAEVHTINGGMAASTASAILATGTPGKRFGYSHSVAVIHDPSYGEDTLETIKDEKLKSELQKYKDSILDIYVKNTKLTLLKASKMMTADTMLNAEQQKEYGLIDEIVPSKMKSVITKNMSYAEIMNVCSDKNNFINIEIPKQKKMSDLTKFYGLVDEADEAAILKKAQEDRSKLELINNKVKSLEKLQGEKDAEISNLKEEVEKYRNEAIETVVDADIKAGKFLEENKDSVLANAKKIGLEAYTNFVKNMPVKTVNVLEMVKNQASDEGEKKSKEQKLGEEWQELIISNKAEAERIKNEEPARYEKMVEAWNNLK